jgi:cellulose 1,4-beta-cellobiosidase
LGDATNCYTGNTWDKTLCPDPATCAQKCAIDGADYPGTYGISTSGNGLTIKFVTNGPYSKNIGSRVYLSASTDAYQIFKLKNKEFTFDVDVSNLPCGLNGALYFVEMAADGGKAANPNNKAGAKYGTGYCDAQCPHDIKWINGEANLLEWKTSPDDPNSGAGKYGSCCNEMDIWEANSISTAYTPHVCSKQGLYRCSGADCGDGNDRYQGTCDKDGCDLNPFRAGVKNFYGKGYEVDTSKPITVVTQFITNDGSDNGELVEIRRLWIQGGKVIRNPATDIPNVKPYDSVTDEMCENVKKAFGDKNDFQSKGGLKGMGAAFERGMVLVMSLWDDHEAHMLWLDSNFPTDADASKPGIARGTCPITSGVPSQIETDSPNASVRFSNIKFGALNTTFMA